MALVLFFFFSVPVGILLDKIGKRKMVNIGMAVIGVSALIPVVYYSFLTIAVAIVLLGIGNTIIQVSANPLLYDVSTKGKFSSNMSLSQFIKAISIQMEISKICNKFGIAI